MATPKQHKHPSRPWKVQMPSHDGGPEIYESRHVDEMSAYRRVTELQAASAFPLRIYRWKGGEGWTVHAEFSPAETAPYLPGCVDRLPGHLHCVHGHTADCPESDICDVFPVVYRAAP